MYSSKKNEKKATKAPGNIASTSSYSPFQLLADDVVDVVWYV
jgi:hypothetical protein